MTSTSPLRSPRRGAQRCSTSGRSGRLGVVCYHSRRARSCTKRVSVCSCRKRRSLATTAARSSARTTCTWCSLRTPASRRSSVRSACRELAQRRPSTLKTRPRDCLGSASGRTATTAAAPTTSAARSWTWCTCTAAWRAACQAAQREATPWPTAGQASVGASTCGSTTRESLFRRIETSSWTSTSSTAWSSETAETTGSQPIARGG